MGHHTPGTRRHLPSGRLPDGCGIPQAGRPPPPHVRAETEPSRDHHRPWATHGLRPSPREREVILASAPANAAAVVARTNPREPRERPSGAATCRPGCTDWSDRRTSAVADWVCPGRAPYLTPQASRGTHASRPAPRDRRGRPPCADPGRADRIPAPPPGAAAPRCAAVTGDTHPPPGHTAWMSQPCHWYGVDVASTP